MGRLLSRNSDKPSIRLGSIISILCVLASTVFSIGCEASRSEVSDSKQVDEHAQADFDWAMKRLRRAIEEFTPPTNRSLRVKRKLSYELIPPNSSQPKYTARITVDSKSAYMPGQFSPIPVDEQSSRPQADDSAFTEELLAKRKNDPTAIQEELLTNPSSSPKVVGPLVDAPIIKERVVYELVYQDERWQLETQPESKHEQMWFEYALQQ